MVADPGPKIQLSSNGSLNLSVEAAGRYEVTTSDHKVYTATVPAAPARLNVEGPWRIYFSPGWGAPASIDMEKLQSWTESKDAGVRYFSGTARYEKTIDVPGSYLRPGNTVYLNLGEVREIAEVRLNGKPLGIAWKKPFRMVLNGALKPGANKLEVEVTNLWPNRLIGDQQLPPEQRLTHTNITKFHADSPLLPSGLLGPVFLSRISVMNLINEPSDVVCHLH
jgi:hypothetical protein